MHEQLERWVLEQLGVIADDVCVRQLATRDVVLQPLGHKTVDVWLGHQLEHLQGPSRFGKVRRKHAYVACTEASRR
jgi:hypothetical protein